MNLQKKVRINFMARVRLRLQQVKKSPIRRLRSLTRKCLVKTLVELAEQDADIVAITAAMPDGTGLNKFAECYPQRFLDVGIAEQHAVTAAAGMAAAGMKPVVAVYSTFLQRAYDSVLHDICMQDLHVTMCLDRAGIVGDDGFYIMVFLIMLICVRCPG